ncbi:unnamed protein product [Eruca vesicaria subsp. sativa]|uniref:Uncharacterized protein n=1 Tax=Eruca vesicaria subsp. sativa TaxID=29727 RepID=A0ABC8L4M4_ERUVS|nr:unnamed protein product [Eruca vesicaria subsp. sativa]
MFGKVKAKAKKLKNRLTKHSDEHDNDVVDEEEEEDEADVPELEKHLSPVNEVPNVRGYTETSKPESLTHPGETTVTEEIIPSGTKDSTDYTRTAQPEPLRDATYEAPSYPVRTSDESNREESRETHHLPLKTPVSLLSETEGATTPGEDGLLGGQREVDTDKPKRFEDDLSGESTYQFKTPYHTRTQGSGEEDDQKSGLGTELESESGNGKDSLVKVGVESETELVKDLPTRSFESETGRSEDFPVKGHEFDQKFDPRISNDGEKIETELGKDLPTRSFESDIGNESPTVFGEKQETERSEDFPAKSHEFDQKFDSRISNDGEKTETELGKELPTRSFESDIRHDSPTIFGGKPETERSEDFPVKSIDSRIGNDGEKTETERREDFPAKSHEFEQTIGSGIGEDNGAGKQGTERREDFLGKNYEFDQEIESTFGKDSPTRLPGDENFPTRRDDMKVEIGLGRELPTETDDHFSPEFSGPKERVDFDSQAEQTRYEAQEVKPTTYSEMIGSPTEKVIDTKNAATSSIGYSSDISGGQHESPVETVADADNEKVKETASPFSGGGSKAYETEQGEDKFVPARDHLNEKLTPEEEDEAFSDMVAEKLNLGGEKKTTAVEKIPSDKLPEEIEGRDEEGKGGGGIVGTIKGVYNYWVGGTEEVKPKSPNSVEESSQPLSSTVGKTNSD